jgi:hypothetical protein
VLWHFTMSLDGFVAGPNHAMEWMTGISFRPGLVGEGPPSAVSFSDSD